MPDWFAVYQESDGELVSVGTVLADPLRAGLAIKRISGPPGREVWNTSTLVFDAKPAPPADVDRVEEVIAAMPRRGNGSFTEADVRAEITKLLGPEYQLRDPDDDRDLSR